MVFITSDLMEWNFSVFSASMFSYDTVEFLRNGNAKLSYLPVTRLRVNSALYTGKCIPKMFGNYYFFNNMRHGSVFKIHLYSNYFTYVAVAT